MTSRPFLIQGWVAFFGSRHVQSIYTLLTDVEQRNLRLDDAYFGVSRPSESRSMRP